MDLRCDRARVERNGEVIEVDPAEVSPGEILLVVPGESAYRFDRLAGRDDS